MTDHPDRQPMHRPINRRRFVGSSAAAAGAAVAASALPSLLTGCAPDAATANRPKPSQSQLTWQRDELALFLHFGVNTYTDREWGDGTESPRIFNPRALDARAWARTARAAGFRAMILTAKHHDGFCLWPTATTPHSVASSPFRNGSGDVVREFIDACRAEGLRAGLYLSPWDQNAPVYGDSPRYNDMYEAQLTELLTRYGNIHEVWFDGANGEGPNGKRQEYDWPRIWGKVRELQPAAVMFSDAGPDVRWIGNERGVAGETNWSTVDPSIVPVPGLSGDEVMRSLQEGDRGGSVWRPGETDVSIRPGWFYHPAENERVRSVDDLVGLYFSSVGRNSKLLLNVPPTREGLLHETDAARLLGMRAALDATFAENLAEGGEYRWRPRRGGGGTATVMLSTPRAVGIVDLREWIEDGQSVAAYALEAHVNGTWQQVATGTTVGYRRLLRIPSVTTDGLRVVVSDAEGPTGELRIGAFGP
ncbi:MAG: alpha-L-fucosidase [Gemmatimonadaceae bacterium]|nr:alpha-L-fucosidase [Gemmatimonadaceae bacterium]